MELVSIRELRNNGAAVLGRVERGETVVITRDGVPIGRLAPEPRRSASPAELIARRRDFPAVDPVMLRRDLDDIIDSEL